MPWNVVLFESSRGEKFVEEFIKTLDEPTVAKVIHVIDLLESYGSRLGMPHTKKLTADLYELRVRGRQEIRILYGYAKKDIYLLHAFIKKKQKTPRQEIDTALKRLGTLTLV
ncbi:MAG: type II toxin-antitoxin system RelE/ParE family toxin [Candidatus Woykebacteria bacterium]